MIAPAVSVVDALAANPGAWRLLWGDLPDFNELTQEVWSAEAVIVCLLSHLRTHEQAPGLQPEEHRRIVAMARTLRRALSGWFGPLAGVGGAGASAGDLVSETDRVGLPSLPALADDLLDAESIARVLAQYLDEVVSSSAYVGGDGDAVFRAVSLVASILARARSEVCRSRAFVDASEGGAA